MSKRRGRLLFVNKKKQKNFFKRGRAGFAVTGPAKQKFFAPLFFKKTVFSCFRLNLSGARAMLALKTFRSRDGHRRHCD
jgi:hypothetical protein